VSRPLAVLAETRAVARKVDELGKRVERLTIAITQLRAGQPSQLVTVARLVELGHGSPATIRRRIADGSIPCIRHGRTVRVDLAALATTEARR
jgi:hypothetical protein